MATERSNTAWNAETTIDLFACFINEVSPGATTIRAVTDRMQAMGYTCTQNAVSHQFAKLKQRKATLGGLAKPGAQAMPSTPAKTPARQTKRKRAADQAVADDIESLPVAKKQFNRLTPPTTPKKESDTFQQIDGKHAVRPVKLEHTDSSFGRRHPDDDYYPGLYEDTE